MSFDGTRTENYNNQLGNQVVLTQAKRFQGQLLPAQHRQSLYFSSEEKLCGIRKWHKENTFQLQLGYRLPAN